MYHHVFPKKGLNCSWWANKHQRWQLICFSFSQVRACTIFSTTKERNPGSLAITTSIRVIYQTWTDHVLSDSVGYPHNSPQGTSGAGENLRKVRVTEFWVLMSLGRRCWSISLGIHIWVKSCWILATYADNDCKYLVWFLNGHFNFLCLDSSHLALSMLSNFFLIGWLRLLTIQQHDWWPEQSEFLSQNHIILGKPLLHLYFIDFFTEHDKKGKNLHETNIFKNIRNVTIKQTNELNANNCKELGIRLGWTVFFSLLISIRIKSKEHNLVSGMWGNAKDIVTLIYWHLNNRIFQTTVSELHLESEAGETRKHKLATRLHWGFPWDWTC